jgi:hypothetical protein
MLACQENKQRFLRFQVYLSAQTAKGMNFLRYLAI